MKKKKIVKQTTNHADEQIEKISSQLKLLDKSYCENILNDFYNSTEITQELDEEDFLKNPKDSIRKTALWKVGRSLSGGLFDSEEELKDVVKKIKDERYSDDSGFNDRTKRYLKKLISIKGVGIPMASCVLRFCNPDVYPIIDKRSYKVIFCCKREEVEKYFISKSNEKKIDEYIAYVHRCHSFYEYYRKNGTIEKFGDVERIAYQLDIEVGNKVEIK